MYISNKTIPFAYLGGKFSVLDWLLPLLPSTYTFVDVFGGSATVILNRNPSKINVYNDINKSVVTFFKVLRESPEQLITALELTPHSRYEYYNCSIENGLSDLELARRFFVRTRQSFLAAGSMTKKKGWAYSTNLSRVSLSEATSKWLGSINGLSEVVEKFRSIQIENRCYQEIVKIYGNSGTLLYMDPPYTPEYRSAKNDYEFDFTLDDHYLLASIARQCNCLIAVSGYDSPIMNELYNGWIKHLGPLRKNNKSTKVGIREVLFTNYNPKVVSGQRELFYV